jgi:hypothetical protein
LWFDDQRALATLEVLFARSRNMQVLFFTHHRHLADLITRSATLEAKVNIFFLNASGKRNRMIAGCEEEPNEPAYLSATIHKYNEMVKWVFDKYPRRKNGASSPATFNFIKVIKGNYKTKKR